MLGVMVTPPNMFGPQLIRPAAARSTSATMLAPFGLVEAAADGDIAAVLETAVLVLAGTAASASAWAFVNEERDVNEESDGEAPSPAPRRALARGASKVAVTVDLGPTGEPKGAQRLTFKPLLPRSVFVQLELRVPLGLVIEETEAGTIVVTGALPGYASAGQVEVGDQLRALTAYREVIGGAPM